jgi:predicted nicotinamide N-methyase
MDPRLADPDAFPYRRSLLSVRAGGHAFSLHALDGFEANVGAVYRRLGGARPDRDPGDWMPMFGVLWPGALTLADRVPDLVAPGMAVLELGCGLGLSSLVAARCGAAAVATDNHPHAGAFLARNARENRIAPVAEPTPGAVSYRHLDWRRPGPEPMPGGFSRVMASDLLFSPDLAPCLARMVARYLAPDGRALLVDPGRLALAAFEASAAAEGLHVEVDVLQEGETELFALRILHAG